MPAYDGRVTEARRRVLQFAVPAAVLGVAAATRLIGLEQPGELVFDETYYVKDAESLRQLGYEGRWPDGANELWAAGTPGSPDTLASFVVHPPLGKWVIALGLALLGPENPAGWRLGTALTGIALVGLVMLLAHLLLGRLVLTGLAGLLIAVDGNAIVMSRVALLDGVLALLIVLAVIFVVLDRRDAHRQLTAWLERRRSSDPPRTTDWGPALWGRPWLLAAGLTFGLATGVKWNALYLLAAEPRTIVVFEAPHRIAAALADARDAMGPDRRAAVCRELTKKFEEVARGTLAELAERFAEGARGEIVLVIEGAPARSGDLPSALAEVASRVEAGERLKDAAAEVAAATGLGKRELYEAALAARRAD
jgi:hypothetical protein